MNRLERQFAKLQIRNGEDPADAVQRDRLKEWFALTTRIGRLPASQTVRGIPNFINIIHHPKVRDVRTGNILPVPAYRPFRPPQRRPGPHGNFAGPGVLDIVNTNGEQLVHWRQQDNGLLHPMPTDTVRLDETQAVLISIGTAFAWMKIETQGDVIEWVVDKYEVDLGSLWAMAKVFLQKMGARAPGAKRVRKNRAK